MSNISDFLGSGGNSVSGGDINTVVETTTIDAENGYYHELYSKNLLHQYTLSTPSEDISILVTNKGQTVLVVNGYHLNSGDELGFVYTNNTWYIANENLIKFPYPTSSDLKYQTICSIDSTHFLLVYSDPNNLSILKAVVCTITGVNFTFGLENTLFTAAGTCSYLTVAKLTSSSCALGYTIYPSGKMCVLSISGDTVTAGTSTSVANYVQYSKLVSLDSTHVSMIYYYYNGYIVKCVGATISGTTVTMGSSKTIIDSNSSARPNFDICFLDSTHVCFVVENTETSKTEAFIGTLSGSTMSVGASNRISNEGDNYEILSVCSLTPTKVVISHQNNFKYIKVGDISGNTITFGGLGIQVVNSYGYIKEMVALDSTTCIVIDKTAILGKYNISGNAISEDLSSILTTYSNTNTCNTIVELTPGFYLIPYISSSAGLCFQLYDTSLA